MTINAIQSNIPIEISKGGTNATSMTNTDGVVYYDGTRLVTTAVGTATQVLTSNGAGVAPTFQAAGGGSSIITSSTVTLLSNDVKTLNATPFVIVTSPGSGKFINVITICIKLNYGGTNAFTASASQTLQARYTNGTGTLVVFSAFQNTAIIATSNQIGISAASAGNGQAASTVENQNLIIWNPIATEISGNAAGNNTIQVHTTYEIVTF